MLVLSRKLNEVIKIGDDVRVVLLKVKGDTVRIGVEAPKHVKILREEIEEEGQEVLRRIR